MADDVACVFIIADINNEHGKPVMLVNVFLDIEHKPDVLNFIRDRILEAVPNHPEGATVVIRQMTRIW